MSQNTFGLLTDRVTSTISRRRSFATLGLAGMSSAFVLPFSIKAKKHERKKSRDKGTRRCQQQLEACTAQEAQCPAQVEECTTLIAALCGGAPECSEVVACCSFLENCNASGFLACLDRPAPAP